MLALVAASVFHASLFGQTATSASEHFQDLTSQMRQAHARGDWPSFRARALTLNQFLNGSPDTLLDLARADAHLGNEKRALDDLRQFAVMGQSSDIVKTLPDFARLRTLPDFESIGRSMQANLTPISRATLAFAMPDSRLVPEDIDYDPQSRRFFLTSVLENKIVSIDANRRMADFAHAPDRWPVLALKIDRARRLIWATEVALDGFTNIPKADWGRSAVLCYSLDRGNLLHRIEGPQHSALGDMALAPNGDLVISDGAGGGVYLMDDGKLKRIDKGDFISPQTPAYTPDGKHVLLPDYVRGIATLDLATGAAHWFSMQDRFALQGIDGMYLHGNSLIATQNGTSPQRIVTFQLAPDLSRVISAQILETATKNLDPTHGVIVGSEFYYIANSGWSALDDAGNGKPGAVLTAARIMRGKAFDQ